MSQERVRFESSGESGSALLSGSRACSMRSLMAGFSCTCGRFQLSERKRDPMIDEGAYAAAPNAKTASAMVTKIRIANTAAIVSDLDPDDLANDEIADRLQANADHQHGMANRIAEQRLDEHRVHEIHAHHDDGRHAHKQEHGEAALRGVDAHLSQDLEPLADYVREVVEDLGEVAARLALQHDGSDEELHVDERNPVDQIAQSFAD